eukprot:5191212-Alexandrium_andersonii.AAC.1
MVWQVVGRLESAMISLMRRSMVSQPLVFSPQNLFCGTHSTISLTGFRSFLVSKYFSTACGPRTASSFAGPGGP